MTNESAEAVLDAVSTVLFRIVRIAQLTAVSNGAQSLIDSLQMLVRREVAECMHACTHARMHACTYARMHARTHARIHARMHACRHARTHVHARAHVHAHVCAGTCICACGVVAMVGGNRVDDAGAISNGAVVKDSQARQALTRQLQLRQRRGLCCAHRRSRPLRWPRREG